MSFFKNLFDGKEIEQQKEETSAIVHEQKKEFSHQMWNIQRQTHKAKKKIEESKLETDKLAKLVDDVAKQYAKATGGLKDE